MRRTGDLEVSHRIGHFAVDPDLEVKVRAEAVAGAVAVADDLALGDLLPGRDRKGLLVGVTGGETATVVDAGVVAIAAAARLRLSEDHGSRSRGADRRAARNRDVDARVVLVGTVD